MLETILTVIAWIALGIYGLVFLSTLPALLRLLLALARKRVSWPGPYITDPQTAYSSYNAMRKPKTLFPTFLSKLGYFAVLIFLILVFIFMYFPQLESFTTLRVVAFIILFAFFSLGGLLEVKPMLGIAAFLRTYLGAPTSGRFE